MDEATNDERKLEVLDEVLKILSQKEPDFYYEPTMQIAERILDYVKNSNELSILNKELLEDMTTQEIQYLLSFHGKGHK